MDSRKIETSSQDPREAAIEKFHIELQRLQQKVDRLHKITEDELTEKSLEQVHVAGRIRQILDRLDEGKTYLSRKLPPSTFDIQIFTRNLDLFSHSADTILRTVYGSMLRPADAGTASSLNIETPMKGLTARLGTMEKEVADLAGGNHGLGNSSAVDMSGVKMTEKAQAEADLAAMRATGISDTLSTEAAKTTAEAASTRIQNPFATSLDPELQALHAGIPQGINDETIWESTRATINQPDISLDELRKISLGLRALELEAESGAEEASSWLKSGIGKKCISSLVTIGIPAAALLITDGIEGLALGIPAGALAAYEKGKMVKEKREKYEKSLKFITDLLRTVDEKITQREGGTSATRDAEPLTREEKKAETQDKKSGPRFSMSGKIEFIESQFPSFTYQAEVREGKGKKGGTFYTFSRDGETYGPVKAGKEQGIVDLFAAKVLPKLPVAARPTEVSVIAMPDIAGESVGSNLETLRAMLNTKDPLTKGKIFQTRFFRRIIAEELRKESSAMDVFGKFLSSEHEDAAMQIARAMAHRKPYRLKAGAAIRDTLQRAIGIAELTLSEDDMAFIRGTIIPRAIRTAIGRIPTERARDGSRMVKDVVVPYKQVPSEQEGNVDVTFKIAAHNVKDVLLQSKAEKGVIPLVITAETLNDAFNRLQETVPLVEGEAPKKPDTTLYQIEGARAFNAGLRSWQTRGSEGGPLRYLYDGEMAVLKVFAKRAFAGESEELIMRDYDASSIPNGAIKLWFKDAVFKKDMPGMQGRKAEAQPTSPDGPTDEEIDRLLEQVLQSSASTSTDTRPSDRMVESEDATPRNTDEMSDAEIDALLERQLLKKT